MMMISLLFALACNLDFLLVNAGQNNNNKRKNKFTAREHGTNNLPRTQEGRIVKDLDYIRENPDMVKSLVPKDMGALFDFVERIIPGAKALKDPIEKTVHHLIPILKELPDVLEKLAPTLREIRKAVGGEGKISDKQLLQWGREMLSQGKHFARIAIKSIQNMPIEQLIAVSEEHDLQSKVLKLILSEKQIKKLADDHAGGNTRGGLPWAKTLVATIVKIMKDSPSNKSRVKRNKDTDI